MPFQSEKQRRYLWANEPEIARDWTDTYGSGIAKALGGRIGFWNGSGNIRQQPHQPRDLLVQNNPYGTRPRYQPPGRGGSSGGPPSQGGGSPSGGGGGGGAHDRGGRQHQATATRQVAATRARDRHPPAPTRSPRPHGGGKDDGGWTRPFESPTNPLGKTPAQRNRELSILGGSDYGQFYRPPPLIERPTFGMRLRSGLGALGRGIGNMAMMFNPYSAALGLAGKARLGSMFNIGSRYANQGGNFLNEWRQYDNLMDYLNRNKNQTTEQMDPELAKYFSGTEGIMDPDSRPEYEIDDSWYLS